MAWNFQRTEQQFDQIPVGDHRVVIDSAEKAVSKNDNEMLVLKLKVSGFSSLLWNYIVFMPDRPEITNQKLTQVFDSFDIEDGNFNLASWVGKAGAVHVKIDDSGRSVVSYYIHKKKQGNLPPWKNVQNASASASSSSAPVGGFTQVADSDTPW